jgi:membrane protease YdiL (CAAX protease family)
MLKNNSIRNLLITIFLILSYQTIGVYISIFHFPGSQFFLMPFFQIIFLLAPVWFLSGNSYEERKSFIGFGNSKIDAKTIIYLALIAISFQIFYNAFSFIQDKIIQNTYFENFIKVRELRNDAIIDFFVNKSIINLIYGIIAISFIPAITEEIIFRGFLQNSYIKEGRLRTSIIVPSIVFAAVHLNPLDFLPLILMSVLLGILSIKSRSISIPIILHLMINFIVAVGYSFLNENKIKEIDLFKDMTSAIIALILTLTVILFASNRLIKLFQLKNKSDDFENNFQENSYYN